MRIKNENSNKGTPFKIFESHKPSRTLDEVASGLSRIAHARSVSAGDKRLSDSELIDSIFNNMPVSYVRRKISDGVTLDCNEYFAKISGYESISDCVENNNSNDYYDDPRERLEFVQEVINSDGRFTYEMPLVNNLNNSIQWFRFGCKANVEEDYIDSIGIEISEQKEVEEKLQKTLDELSASEDRLRKFYDNAEVGFFRSHFSTGEVVESNLKMAEIMGFNSVKDYLNSDLLKYVFDARWSETWKQLRSQIRINKKVSDYEAVAEKLNGEKIYLNVSAVYDEERDIIEGSVFDVTDKKRAIRALFQTELRYKEVAERNPGFGFQLLVSASGKYNLVFIGGQLEEYFGITEAEAYENPLKLIEYFHPEDKYSVLHSVKNLSLKTQSWSTKFRVLTPMRGTKVLQGFTSPTVVENGDILWNTVCMDITEQARLEDERVQLESQLKQSQKMEALGTLAGGIAHDFNNILQGISFAIESCLIDKSLSPKVVDRLEKSKKFLWRGSELVKQILSFCRRDEQKFKPIVVEEQLSEVMNLMRSSLPANVEAKVSVLNKHSIINGSSVQLQQVLMNLCSNAGYSMREDGGTIQITLRKSIVSKVKAQKHKVVAGEFVLLSVEDSGPGVPEELRHRIFEPFYTTKPIGEGTGMGLAVAAGIIEAHGGFIEFETSVHNGACFKIYFPKLSHEINKCLPADHAM